MRRLAFCSAALAALLGAASAAWALQAPGRTITRKGTITAQGLTHASVAFAVKHTTTDCDHVELWNTDTRGTWRFGRPHPCDDLPIFYGISSVEVATKRVLWISFAGGNLTDWQLWTATPTSKTPRRLAFVERDTTAPPAIRVGQGTPDAVPYAVGNEVTLLGDNGARVFRWTAPAEVRAVTSGNGPYGWRVATLLANGDVTVLDSSGAVVRTYSFGTTPVRWIGLAPAGLLVELPEEQVEIHRGSSTRTVQLMPNAIVLDYAEGSILYRVGSWPRSQSYWFRRVSGGTDSLLLEGSRKHPIYAALDTHGLAWAQGTRVNWACAGCIRR
jgi:hypothetical protein